MDRNNRPVQDGDGWPVCSECGERRARIGFRTTVEEITALVEVVGPDSFEDETVDSDILELVEETLLCFECHREEHGDRWLKQCNISDMQKDEEVAAKKPDIARGAST